MNIATGYEWATHQPVIRAAMDVYKPQFVLELGVGMFSTPVFKEYDSVYLGLENNKEWVEKIKSELDVEIFHHDLGEITEGMGYTELSLEQKFAIIRFYNNLILPNLHPKLLFVDQFTSCRTFSINALREKFDLIIYHDSESWQVNRYDLIDKLGFYLYELVTSGPCTMLMAKIDKPEIKVVIKPHIDQFMREHPECTKMELQVR